MCLIVARLPAAYVYHAIQEVTNHTVTVLSSMPLASGCCEMHWTSGIAVQCHFCKSSHDAAWDVKHCSTWFLRRIYNYCQQKHPKTKVMAAGIRRKEGMSCCSCSPSMLFCLFCEDHCQEDLSLFTSTAPLNSTQSLYDVSPGLSKLAPCCLPSCLLAQILL